jgi:outer membrane protein TolC
VERARAEFDPVVGTDLSVGGSKELPARETLRFDTVTDETTGEEIGVATETTIIRPKSKVLELTPRLSQKVITGGNYELQFVNTRDDSSPEDFGNSRLIENPRYDSAIELTLTQPLLRGFGIAVNLAPTRRAEKAVEIAEQQVVQTILDVVFEVQSSYWDLTARIDDLASQREALKLAQDFLEENTIRVELGTLAPIELVQAETQVKVREEAVIVAEAAVKEAEDQLKEILNIPQTLGTWYLRVRPTDSPPFVPIAAIAVEEQIRQALKQRPDFLSSQLDIASREIARFEAINRRLPKLDFVGRGALRAFADDPGESTGDLSDGDGYEWSVGLQFEYPLGNRAARNELTQRLLELQRAQVDQQRLQRTIERQVRQAARNIETAVKRVEVTRAATKLAKTQLEAEQEKFRLGLSTSFRVLEFQRELTDARTGETRALSDYNVELARLDQRTGTFRYGKITPEQ